MSVLESCVFASPPQSPAWCYLSKDKGLLIVGGVKAIVHHHTSAKLLPDGVCWEPVHVHLDICANFLVRQKLPREDLKRKTRLNTSEGATFIIITVKYSANAFT